MPATPAQLGRPEDGLPEAEAALWPPPPCGPCIPILLGLAALAAFFLLTTAALAERLFRRAPAPVWRPGGDLWIEAGSAPAHSEHWFGCEAPLLAGRAPPGPGPGPVPQGPVAPAPSSFWGPPPREGLLSWAGSDAASSPGSPEPDWSLQPRVTLEQISAFWRREGRPGAGC